MYSVVIIIVLGQCRAAVVIYIFYGLRERKNVKNSSLKIFNNLLRPSLTC